jgi:hypothetical protein
VTDLTPKSKIRFSKMKIYLVCSSAIGLLLIASGASENKNAKYPIQVRIARHSTAVGVGKGNDLPNQLFVVITNVSDAPVRIWDQWNGWGYDNLTFSMQTDNRKIRKTLKRFGGENGGHGPESIELGPGDHYVCSVRFAADDQNDLTDSWGPLVIRNGEYPWITLRADYEIKADDFSRQKNVWTGRVSSPPVRIRVQDETGQHGAKDELTEENTSE